MKLYFFLIVGFVVLSTNSAAAQQVKIEVISNGGSNTISSDFQFSSTIGEAIGTVLTNNSEIILSQGFEQPVSDTLTTSISYNNLDIPTLIYPNPTFGPLTINVSHHQPLALDAVIYNIEGKLMGSYQLTNGDNHLNIENFASSSYSLVIISPDKKALTSEIIQKIN